MAQNDNIQLFEDKRIRTAWDEEKEEWYFSIVDVVAVLTDQPDYQAARNYWKVTKKRLKDEGNEAVTACNQLKMTASDGKKRLTDVADTEQLLRIIQSIPSPKAEPFKLWLAQVGRERIEETIDPELTIDRALETYLKKGYSREWINQRLQAIQVRKQDFAIRSGLIQKERLFTPEQMTEIYRCCADSVDGDFFELTGEQEKMIRSVQQQIEECVPDLDERIRQQEEALEQATQEQTM